MKNQSISQNIDWISIIIYSVLVIMGWLNIYSSSLSTVGEDSSILDFSQVYGKQFLFILFTIPIIFIVLFVEAKFYEKFSIVIFAISILSLLGLFVFGKVKFNIIYHLLPKLYNHENLIYTNEHQYSISNRSRIYKNHFECLSG